METSLPSSSKSSPTESSSGPTRTQKGARPCDACRKAKRRCFLVGEAGSGCVACKTASIACTFEAPASKRKAPPANRPSATSPPGGAAVPGPSTQPPPPPAPLVSPALSVLFNTTGPSSSAVLPQSLSMHAFSSLNAYPTGPPARPFIPSFRSSFIGAGSSSSSSSEPSDPHAATPLDSAFRSNFGSASSDPHAATPLDSDPSSLFYSNVDDSSLSSRVRDVSGGSAPVIFVQAAMGVYKGKARAQERDLEDAARLNKILRLLPSPEWADKLRETFVDKVLPALPVFDLTRIEASPILPTGLILGILGQAAILHQETRGLFRSIWSEVADVLIESYRHPHLVTLQIAILDFTSRPDVDPAGNTLAIARAVGAAHLMGLHRDCSTWSLPLWERRLRKRLWWMLLIADRWICLYQGRPAQIHNRHDTWDVATPVLSDFEISPSTSIDSPTSFLAMCALTELLYAIDQEFFSLRAQAAFRTGRASAQRRLGRETRLRLIGSYGEDLKKIEREHATILGSATAVSAATGVKSAQLSYLGLTIVLGRLTVEVFDPEDPTDRPDIELALSSALALVEDVVVFCEKLTLTDVANFWISFSGYHLSNSFSLLVRCLLIARRLDLPAIITSAVATLTRFFAVLLATHTAGWEVSERALAKALALMPSVSRLLPEVGQIWTVLRGRVWADMKASETAEVLLALIPDAAAAEARTVETNVGGGLNGRSSRLEESWARHDGSADQAADAFSSDLPNFAAPPLDPPLDFYASSESFQAVIGEEDLWAGLGDPEGFAWMGLGFSSLT